MLSHQVHCFAKPSGARLSICRTGIGLVVSSIEATGRGNMTKIEPFNQGRGHTCLQHYFGVVPFLERSLDLGS